MGYSPPTFRTKKVNVSPLYFKGGGYVLTSGNSLDLGDDVGIKRSFSLYFTWLLKHSQV